LVDAIPGYFREVEVNEVNGFVRNVLAEDLEIVAVIELIHFPQMGLAGCRQAGERNLDTNFTN